MTAEQRVWVRTAKWGMVAIVLAMGVTFACGGPGWANVVLAAGLAFLGGYLVRQTEGG